MRRHHDGNTLKRGHLTIHPSTRSSREAVISISARNIGASPTGPAAATRERGEAPSAQSLLKREASEKRRRGERRMLAAAFGCNTHMHVAAPIPIAHRRLFEESSKAHAYPSKRAAIAIAIKFFNGIFACGNTACVSGGYKCKPRERAAAAKAARGHLLKASETPCSR